MSVWVRAYLPTSAGSLDVRVLEEGVRQRLSPLANLVCPEAEMPDDVLDRLRVDAEDSDNWMIFYREEEDRYIPVERFSGDEAVEEIEEALEDLERYPDQDAERVRDSLSGIVETIGFELKYSDLEGWGLPVAIAAAARLVDLYGGIINVDGYGWMLPSGDEVEMVAEDDA